MKISEIITDKYKLRIPPTVYYELLADIQEVEENQEPTNKNDLGVDLISRADAIRAIQEKAKKLTNKDTINGLCGTVAILFDLPSVTPQEFKKETITYLDGFADGLNMANNSTNKMLDKIRAEMQSLRNCSCSCSDGIIDDVEDILDKYKAESEPQESGDKE